MSYLNWIAAMTANSSSWSVDNFLKNLQNSLGDWSQIIVVIIGLVMLIVGIFNIAKGLMSQGRGQTNWFMNIVLFFVGGALCFSGGWGLVKKVSKSGQDTVNDLGNGTKHDNSWQETDEAIVIDMGNYIISVD